MSKNKRYLPFEQYVHRPCFICGNDISDMRHAITVKAGAGLTACAHASCGASLQDEINERVAATADHNDPRRQYANVNEPAEPMQVINLPCLVCHKQVTNGTTMTLGDNEYAVHPGCKQRAQNLITQALGASMQYNLHPESVVRRLSK